MDHSASTASGETSVAPADTHSTDSPRAESHVSACEPEVPKTELLGLSEGLVTQEAPGWNYRQQLREDLDGDGEPETLWVLAEVEMVRGQPAWDDGQPWQVYVEEGSGEVTHLFARYVQLAQLEVSVALGNPPEILVDASGPSTAVLYRLRYDGPNRFVARRVLEETNISQPHPVP